MSQQNGANSSTTADIKYDVYTGTCIKVHVHLSVQDHSKLKVTPCRTKTDHYKTTKCKQFPQPPSDG